MQVGYARVSTSDQDTRLQLDALQRAGVQQIYRESCSGIGQRPALRQCLKSLRRGDVLVVWKIDRIARSLHDLLSILQRLHKVGVGLKSLTEPIDTTSAIGEFMLQVLGAVAQLERSMIRERVIAGQVAAIQRGQQHGRPKKLNQEQQLDVIERMARNEKASQVARLYNVDRSAISRIWYQAKQPDHPRWGPHRPVLGPLLEKDRSTGW